MRKLYHGTIEDIQIIDTSMGKGYKDFGKGFYATANKEHAERIAKRNKKIATAKEDKIAKRIKEYKRTNKTAYRYNLVFSENLEELHVKVFKEADVEWVRFILKNRKSPSTIHDYDIVIGPTADEETTTIINAYENVLEKCNYSDEILIKLISELKPENLPKQYFFASEKAISTLKFDRIRREIVG